MLFNDPDKALEGYELTEEEASALKELENEHFDATAEDLEERVSRAGFGIVGDTLPKTHYREGGENAFR